MNNRSVTEELQENSKDDHALAQTITKACNAGLFDEVMRFMNTSIREPISPNILGVAHEISCSNLVGLIARNFHESFNALLRAGLDINYSTPAQNKENNKTAFNFLFISLLFNSSPKMIQLILDKGIAVDYVLNSVNANALLFAALFADDKDIFNMVVKCAEDKGLLDEMLRLKDINGNGIILNILSSSFNLQLSEAIVNLCLSKKIILDELKVISNNLFNKAINSNDPDGWLKLLNVIHKNFENKSTFVWSQPQKLVIDSDQLKPATIKNVEIQKGQDLFGYNFDLNLVISEEDALKVVLVRMSALLSAPERCLPMLKLINDELERYLTTNHLATPHIDKKDYTFKLIDSTYFPVPTENSSYLQPESKRQNKSSALKHVLISLMKQFGLADTAVRWVGFVEKDAADQTVREGKFLLESAKTGVTALHGIYSHEMQLAITLLAIANGIIDTKVRTNDGRVINITPQQIMKGLIDIKEAGKASVWMSIMDRRSETVTFTDPYRLPSCIMRDGHELGMGTLSAYLTDSTLKSIVNLFNNIRAGKASNLNYPIFAELIGYSNTSLIPHVSNQPAFDKYNSDPVKYKVIAGGGENPKFMVVQMNYKPSGNFEFQTKLTQSGSALFHNSSASKARTDASTAIDEQQPGTHDHTGQQPLKNKK